MKIFLIHPDAMATLQSSGQISEAKPPSTRLPFHLLTSMMGIPYRVDRAAMAYEPPQDPFIEYEPSDYRWLRKFGYGRMVPGIVEMNMPSIPKLF